MRTMGVGVIHEKSIQDFSHLIKSRGEVLEGNEMKEIEHGVKAGK